MSGAAQRAVARSRSGGWAYNAGMIVLAAGAVVTALLDASEVWELAPLLTGLLVMQLTAASRRHAKGRWHPRALREVEPWLLGALLFVTFAFLPDHVIALVFAIYLWALEWAARWTVARRARPVSTPRAGGASLRRG